MSQYSKLKKIIVNGLSRHPYGRCVICYRNRKRMYRHYVEHSKRGIIKFPFPPYNISALLEENQNQGLGLVFFMGMGDYLLTTPVIEKLRKSHPDRFMRAYTGRFTDNNNSELNYCLMSANPNFDDIVQFDGYPRSDWWFYETSMAYNHNENNGKSCIMLPVLYEHPIYRHRTVSLAKTFGFPEEIDRPILYDCKPSREKAEELMDKNGGFKGRHVILLHCESRSACMSEYELKMRLVGMLRSEFKDAVIVVIGDLVEPRFIRESLTRKEYKWWTSAVLDSGKNLLGDPKSGGGCIPLKFDSMSILDSIEVVRLAQQNTTLTAICVNSVFWPVSSALAIPTLGLHLFSEHSVVDYWYGNIHILSSQYFEQIPQSKQSLNIKHPNAAEHENTYTFDDVQILVEYKKLRQRYAAYQEY